MSSRASHEPEAFAGLLFEQPLDFQLCLGGAGKCGSQVKHGTALWLPPVEGRLDEHECRASQNSVDQKKILETVCVYRRNPAPFHSSVLPALGATAAQGKTCTLEQHSSSKFDSAPRYYGKLFQHGTGFATVAGAA
jgi:hypothetical protein